MGRRILVGVLLLAAIGCGFFFFAMTFHHGMNAGMIRLRRMEGEGMMFGLGMLAFLVAALVSWPWSKKDEP